MLAKLPKHFIVVGFETPAQLRQGFERHTDVRLEVIDNIIRQNTRPSKYPYAMNFTNNVYEGYASEEFYNSYGGYDAMPRVHYKDLDLRPEQRKAKALKTLKI